MDHIKRKHANCDRRGNHAPAAISGRRPNMQTKIDKNEERDTVWGKWRKREKLGEWKNGINGINGKHGKHGEND